MRIHFLGANRQVTGSRYCLEVGASRVMIDCGMFQERKYEHRNWDSCPVPPDSLDALVLTHAHIDHCGLLPRLVRQGFEKPIYTTQPTVDLVDIMLRDSARIQAEDLKYKQKRHKKEGRTSKFPYELLYSEDDATETLGLLWGVAYRNKTQITPDVSVTFHDAGHILGSACLEFDVRTTNGQAWKIVFSGDIGQWGKPIIRDPVPLSRADFLVMESTYGDRLHKERGDVSDQLADVIRPTVERGGKVVIPTFAVERTQELIYHIGQLVSERRIPVVPVIVDSPMAVDVTETFRNHKDSFDSVTWERILSGDAPFSFPNLLMSRTTDESKAINRMEGPAVIMSTSGMCTAGRIKHHLRRTIENPNNTILFVGYQAEGTLGRVILRGKSPIRIHGREYELRARIEQIHGFSGHGDRDDLLRWCGSLEKDPRHVFLTHGEKDSAMALADALGEKGWQATVPNYQEVIELS